MHQGPFQFHTTMGGSPLLEIAPTTTGTTVMKDNWNNNNLSDSIHSRVSLHRYGAASSSVGGESEQYSSSNHAEGRKVHFTVTVKKQEILNLDDYSSKEKTNCWYTADEKAKITEKWRKTAARMDAGKPEKVRPYRGLEHWTEQGANRFYQQVALVITGVMDEQDNQWIADCDDHDRIASICRALTAPCAQRARQVALEDQEVAMSIRQSMFDDVGSCLTDDDSVASFAHVVAKKRREQARQKKAEEAAESKSLRKARRQRRAKQLEEQSSQQQQQQDPPGEKKVVVGGNNKKPPLPPRAGDQEQKQQHPGVPPRTPSFVKKLRKFTNVRKQ